MLERVEALLQKMRDEGVSEADIGARLKRLIHSRALGLLVSLTRNPVDNAVLEILRELFPRE